MAPVAPLASVKTSSEFIEQRRLTGSLNRVTFKPFRAVRTKAVRIDGKLWTLQRNRQVPTMQRQGQGRLVGLI
jgi:hypothetical protein